MTKYNKKINYRFLFLVLLVSSSSSSFVSFFEFIKRIIITTTKKLGYQYITSVRRLFLVWWFLMCVCADVDVCMLWKNPKRKKSRKIYVVRRLKNANFIRDKWARASKRERESACKKIYFSCVFCCMLLLFSSHASIVDTRAKFISDK